jgi:hypothetical protein
MHKLKGIKYLSKIESLHAKANFVQETAFGAWRPEINNKHSSTAEHVAACALPNV